MAQPDAKTPKSSDSNPNPAKKLDTLRQAMTAANVSAYLVPREDAFRGESVPPECERLAYLNGFTGSAGVALVTQEKAVLFVDGRYTLQAAHQTDPDLWQVVTVDRATLPDEIKEHVPAGARLGYDPMLFTPSGIAAIDKLFENRVTRVPTANLIDEIWGADRPAPAVRPIEELGENRTGQSATSKLDDLRAFLGEKSLQAAFLPMPDTVAWLLNFRGRDVPEAPIALAYALVHESGKPTVYFYSADPNSVSDALRSLADFKPMASLSSDLATLGHQKASVWLDPGFTPSAIIDQLREAGAQVYEGRDPVSIPKTRKNEVELSGMRQAQQVDALAMVKFLSWLDREAPKGNLTEMDIADRLEAFRAECPDFVSVSFNTISGAGPNGAIVHYRATEDTNRRLNPGEILLVDSGGQYSFGTTDTTRTMATGSVTEEQRDRFTRVLKGMIAVSRARFPKGASGAQLDTLARQYLWQGGLNYGHGTGHGVGHYLLVHEGPIGISPRATEPLAPGNILSNEPGYYKDGEYGIRIENLVHVTESETPGFLEFETLTYIPIDRRLIDKTLLDTDELEWLNAYHAETYRRLSPELEGSEKEWLAEATAAI